MGKKTCPACNGDTVVMTGDGWKMCITCMMTGTVYGGDAPTPPPPPPPKVQTPEELSKAGSRLIAAVLGGGFFFLTVTSSLSGEAVLGLTLVVFAAVYFIFAHPLAFISSGLMELVEILVGAVTLLVTVGVYLLGAAVILFVVYVLVT